MANPSRKNRQRTVRRLFGLVVVLGICASLFPVPIAPTASQSTDKDLSEPFPCQNRPCGCQSAAQCWKKCCCFTDTQKVAWAKANHVELPGFVVEAAKREAAANVKASGGASRKTKKSGASASHCACCQKKSVAVTAPRCCVEKEVCRPTKSESSCSSKEPPKPSSLAHKKPLTSKWIMAVFAAKCQGQDSIPFCLPCSVIPSPPELKSVCCALTESFLMESDRLQRKSRQPPLPPPKIASANRTCA